MMENGNIDSKIVESRPSAVAHACDPSTLGGLGGWITRSRDWDLLGQHGKTPPLLTKKKVQKLAGHGGVCLKSQLLGRLSQENCLNPGGKGCSELRSLHCTPAWHLVIARFSWKGEKEKETTMLVFCFKQYILLTFLRLLTVGYSFPF